MFMNVFAILLTVTLALSLGMCSSSKKNKLQAENEATGDSTLSSTPLPPPPPAPISPGMAHVTAEVVRVDSSATGYVSIIRIKEVHGYGSGTPPLATESEIEIQFQPNVLKNQAPLSIERLLAPANTIEATLKHRELSKLLGDQSPAWQALSIQ